ncbi:MAG: site-2 protease family protein [Acidobacteriota bacterium]
MDVSLPYVVSLFVVLIVSLSVHEAAHAWTADRLGDPTARMLGRLTLNPIPHIDPIGTLLFPLVAMVSGFPLIGWAKPVPVDVYRLRSPRRDFALVAVAGPISNLLLAAVGVVLFRTLDATGGLGPTLDSALFAFVFLNVFLAVFNMLPVPPLDGGNVLAGLVPESMARVIDSVRPYGIFVLYALLFMGVIGAIARPLQIAVVRMLT